MCLAFNLHAIWGPVGQSVAWLVTGSLIISGLVGCVIPALPGHVIILLAAVAHRLMLGSEGSGLEWWSFAILGIIMLASQAMEMVSGAAGSKWFGGSRWGAAGALIGGIVGMFFMPFGLLVGPLAGAFLCELWFAKQKPRPAAMSGVGSAVGVVAGIGIKLVLGLAMAAWLVADAVWLGR